MLARCALALALAVTLAHAQEDPAAPPAPPPTPGAVGHFSFGIGAKFLESDWEPASHFLLLALDFDIRGRSWPFALAFGWDESLGGSAPNSVKHATGVEEPGTPSIREITLGVRHVFEKKPRFQPFVGAGFDRISARFQQPKFLFDYYTVTSDSTMGFYVEAGFYAPTALHDFCMGLRARYSKGSLELYGVPLEGGGLNLVMLLTGCNNP